MLKKNACAKPKIAIYVKTESITALLVAKPRLVAKPLVAKPSGDCTVRRSFYVLLPSLTLSSTLK